MPWLNLNKEIGHNKTMFHDWLYWDCDDEDFDDKYIVNNWLTACENYPEMCEDMPYRESHSTRELLRQGWGFKDSRRYPKVHNKPIWKYRNLLLERSVGKPFDVVYSNWCFETRSVGDYRNMFISRFQCNYGMSEYIVDSNGNIQIGYQRGKRKGHEKRIIKSKDYSIVYEYSDKLGWRHRVHTPSYWRALNQSELKVKSEVGLYIEYDSDDIRARYEAEAQLRKYYRELPSVEYELNRKKDVD